MPKGLTSEVMEVLEACLQVCVCVFGGGGLGSCVKLLLWGSRGSGGLGFCACWPRRGQQQGMAIRTCQLFPRAWTVK